MSHYTPRVGARAELAKALKTKLSRAIAVGIKESDLDIIAVEGDKAREADREQNEQLADVEANIKARSERDASILERGLHLRDLLPAVIYSLEQAGHRTDATFLGALTFSRFRMRDVPPPDPALADDPAVKKVERVEREDKQTRLAGLANFVATILTRPNIVAEYAARGVDEAWLEALRADADAAARAGRNVRLAAEATAREAEAVQKQKAVWNANRRLIRKAVKGDPELERLFAEC